MQTNPFFKIHTIRTPDGDSIKFSVLNKKQVNESINTYKMTPASEEYKLNDGTVAYVDSSSNVFIVQLISGQGYLFDSKMFFINYKSGKTYHDTYLFPTKEGAVYSGFKLNPDQVKPFLDKNARLLPEFKPFEGYTAYQLEDGAVLFCRYRVNNLYDAYWYPTKEDFEFSYRSFTH